jgi:maltose O-acetyltransferase
VIRALVRKLTRKISGRLSLDDLAKMGMKVGTNCFLQDNVAIDHSHCWHIEIGNNVTFGPHVQVLAHDASTKRHLGYTRIGKVIIEDNVFVGAGSIILPNVRIGKNSIIGAGSVVNRDIPANVVAGGNPARLITGLADFLAKHRAQIDRGPCFGSEYTLGQGVSAQKKAEMNSLMENGQGYIE